MEFQTTPIPGAYKIVPPRHSDARGYFTRLYCKEVFLAQGISEDFVQTNYSYSELEGTLRGLHYQLSPFSEGKLVSCVAGKIWDCLVDLREDSPMYGKYFGLTLSAEEGALVYLPKGVAHGFITLEPKCSVLYQVTEYYHPKQERGIRFNDPAFSILWPKEPTMISPRDLAHPDFPLLSPHMLKES